MDVGSFGISDTCFLDRFVDVNNQSYYYRLKVVDSCEYSGPFSNLAKTILLDIDNNEEYPVLNWSMYLQWPKGVRSYEIYSENEKAERYDLIGTVRDTIFSFYDKTTKHNQKEYCYKVVTKSHNDSIISISNKACIPTDFYIWVPNAFSPNEDNKNDVFQIVGKNILEYKLVIYNRWGEELFESENIEYSWDGAFKGEKCPAGTYYIQVMARGPGKRIQNVKGGLLLLR